MRYIPELVSLCSRELARQIREMTFEERYHTLRSIPDDVVQYIKAFPLNFFVWCMEQEINLQIINYFKSNNDNVIQEIYIHECKNGIEMRKIFLRKCENYYCENNILDNIIKSNKSIYYHLCSQCYKFNIVDRYKFKIELKSKIDNK